MKSGAIIATIIALLVIAGFSYYLVQRTETPSSTASSTPPVVTPTPTPTPTPQAGAPVVTTDSGVAATNSTVVVTGRVNPNGAQTTYWYEYGKTTALGTRTSAQSIGSGYANIPSPGYITGLSPSILYYFRLSAQNSFGIVNGSTFSFTTKASGTPPPANAPTTKTLAATTISRTTANLNGQVNPNGSQTSYWFEYGQTQSLGGVSSFQSAGSENSVSDVSVSLSSLQPSTKYFFRVNAQNQFGTINGAILNFTTAGPAAINEPDVEAKAASAVGAQSATVNGSVTPNGATTTYWFEYSTNSLIGSVLGTATPEKTITAGASKTDVSASLTGLAKNTKYNYRLAARNSEGTVRSEVMSFTTAGN